MAVARGDAEHLSTKVPLEAPNSFLSASVTVHDCSEHTIAILSPWLANHSYGQLEHQI